MRLVSFKVQNYRNVNLQCELCFGDYTVFVGGNNQGKTNCLKAIDVATNLIKQNRNSFLEDYISFEDDYPKAMQRDKLLSPTVFEISFSLSNEERKQLFKSVGVRNNGQLALRIEVLFQQFKIRNVQKAKPVSLNIYVKDKRGKAATSYKQNISSICSFISNNFDYVYIPAIRNEEDSISVIRNLVALKIKELNSDNDYLEQLASINEKEKSAVNTICDNLVNDLKEYLPDINKVYIDVESGRRMMRNAFNFLIDDGVETSLGNKGAGIISLVALALIQGQSKSNAMVAIEEPESHLHADSIHKIRDKLFNASVNKQIVVSTHNPTFLNHNDLNHTYLVKNGCITLAKTKSVIREELGLSPRDSLFFGDTVIVVEGASDSRFIKRIIEEYSDQLKKKLIDGTLEIYSTQSSSKIIPTINECRRWLIDYFAVFDNDESGRSEYERLNDASHSYLIPLIGKKKKAELEDILPTDIVIDAFKESGVIVTEEEYAKNKKKFNEYAKELIHRSGLMFDENLLESIKTKIVDKFIALDLKKINYKLTDIYKVLVQKIESLFV